MISLSSPQASIKRLSEALNGSAKLIRKELAIATNETARFCKSQIAKEIQATGINTTQKVIKSALTDSGRANANDTSVKVTLKKGFRFGLDAFKAKERKKGGVQYKISKGGGNRVIPNAFIPKKYGRGKVYIRKGNERGPLRQMRGVSPWGVFVKNRKTKPVSKRTEAELTKQVERRIRLLMLRASGQVPQRN